MLLRGTTSGRTNQYLSFYTDCSVLKIGKQPLSSIESFALEFAPKMEEEQLVTKTADLKLNPTPTITDSSVVSEVPTVSVHALDVLAEIYAEKQPALAKWYLLKLADEYDTMRKGYWQFRLEKLGVADLDKSL